MIETISELNKKKLYTIEQLKNNKKFDGKYLDTYPVHHEYWNGRNYITVYEVRGMSNKIKENYQTAEEINN